MIEIFLAYFELPFVRNALIVGTLIAVCSGMLGTVLVLRKMSFIGTGISNVGFGVSAVATAVQLSNNFLLVVPIAILCSIWLVRTDSKSRISPDAKLAMLAAGSVGIGYLIMNLYTKSANMSADVCTVLFGSASILTLSQFDVWVCLVLSVLVSFMFILLYNRVFSVTFDSDFMAATGMRANAYNVVFAVVVGIVISLSMRFVGSLLISALVVFPVVSATSVFRSFKRVTICSVIISVVAALSGMLVSIDVGTPVGATIVAVNAVVFVGFQVTGCFMRKFVSVKT